MLRVVVVRFQGGDAGEIMNEAGYWIAQVAEAAPPASRWAPLP